MPAYLVRLIDSRDLVGFYFAEEATDLATIVDECTEVADCEYAELPDGGITWGSPAIAVPIEIDKDDPTNIEDFPRIPWSGASLSESWWSVLTAMPMISGHRSFQIVGGSLGGQQQAGRSQGRL